MSFRKHIRVFVYSSDYIELVHLRKLLDEFGGYEVYGSTDAPEALKHIVRLKTDPEDERPLVVLAECFPPGACTGDMPVYGGAWLAEEIAKYRVTQDVRVLMFCEHPTTMFAGELTAYFRRVYGAVGYVPRLFPGKELLDDINAMIWLATEPEVMAQ